MAKHFVKLEDGHWAWLTDDEYKKHRRGGCLTTIIAILFIGLMAKNGDGDSKDNNKNDHKTEQVSKKEKGQSKKEQKSTDNAINPFVTEEVDDTITETSSALQLQLDPIGVEEEEPEEIIPIGGPGNNASDDIIE